MGRPRDFIKSPSFLSIIVVVVVTLGAAAGKSSHPPEVPCYFIFGDSIFDNGNNNNLQTLAKVNYSPYGVDFPAGPTGRFTNGQTVADLVGQLLGIEGFIPSFGSKPNGSEILLGVNYASAAAGILAETGKQTGDNIEMDKQLENHDKAVSRITNILRSKKSARSHLAKCVYISNMGNNDYINNYLLPQSNISKMYNPDQFAAFLIEKYTHQMKRMYNLGARKVALIGLLPIGCLPLFITNAGGTNDSPCVASLNQLVALFNARLGQLVARLNLDFSDAKFVYQDPTSGVNLARQALAVKTTSCCKLSNTTGLCISNLDPCQGRSSYLFWDRSHPTEAANRIIAPLLYQAIEKIL